MMQFNDDDHKAVSDFLGLLVNLGMTPTEAYKNVDRILQKQGWAFAFFNDLKDFWIISNELK